MTVYVRDDKKIEPFYIHFVHSALEIMIFRKHEREKPTRLMRRRELPGIIKTKFTRALEKTGACSNCEFVGRASLTLVNN